LSGEWNINFLQDGLHVREINNVLIRYNLINKVPTRITKTSSSLLDVIIIHEEKLIEPARVIELEMSGHYAQILSIPIKTHSTRSYKVFERQLNEENMQEFLHLLQLITNILLIEKNLTSLQEKIVNVMKQLENWFLSNDLIINTGKTKAILFQGN
jgi:hypothetical protein